MIPAPTAAYVHIPFCRRRCYYCDFPISVVGDRQRGEALQAINPYVEVLCQEIATTPVAGPPLQTIFFGGGTPSLISPTQLHQILETLRQQFGWADSVEISMEMDPGTFTLCQLRAYLTAGVNRISLGAQAFQDHLLTGCGRSHTVTQIYESVDILHQAEVHNFSLDLISGLPQQTLDHWQTSLEQAVQLSPPHLSTYDLVLEPTTAFGKRYDPGVAPLPSDETAVQMYCCAAEVLPGAGYEHYEISNYAQPGYQCRHNLVYWVNGSYYGFGMGATSYVKGQRVSRPRTRAEYFLWVKSLIATEGKLDCPVDTATDRLLETLMLGLRLRQGLDLDRLQHQFGPDIVDQIVTCLHPFQCKGWVELLPSRCSPLCIRLTDPQGFLFSNRVLVALWQTLQPE